MGKLLQPTQRKRVPVFRLEDNQRLQRIDQAALARDAKLGGKVGVDVGDDFDGEGFGHRDPPCDGVAQTLFSFGFCLPFIVAYF